MTTKVFEYKSGPKRMSDSGVEIVLETGEKDGIKHTWSGLIDEDHENTDFTWKFDWGDLKKQGVDRLVGQLILKFINDDWGLHRVVIDWTHTKQSVLKTFRGGVWELVAFEYNLTAHYAEKTPPKSISIDKMFAASDMTDAILMVERKKLNVNKAFLSIHSDYFKTLFFANFKEGQMEEIEIKEVSYEDFGLLLSAIYPMQVFPNDKTAEKLLELADRFLMPSVKHLVEHHLLNQSKLENEKMMMLGDQYKIKSILERSISQTDTVEKMKKLKMSPEYAKLSSETVARLFERVLQIV